MIVKIMVRNYHYSLFIQNVNQFTHNTIKSMGNDLRFLNQEYRLQAGVHLVSRN